MTCWVLKMHKKFAEKLFLLYVKKYIASFLKMHVS